MESLAKKISAIAGLIVLTFSSFFFLEARHAPMSAYVALEKRVTLQELRRLLREAEEEMYHYRKLHRKYPDDEEIKEKLKEAEGKVEELKERIRRREEDGET